MTIFTKAAHLATTFQSQVALDDIVTGDFNGDGKTDFLVSRIDYSHPSAPASTPLVFEGNGNGGFSDATSAVFGGNVPTFNFVARMVTGDFNNDGITDVFAIESGADVAPFTGGQNKLLVSNASTHQLVDATSNLPQEIQFNHGASVGDVNGDGNLDILVNALMQSGNELLMNDGTGYFTKAPTPINPSLSLPSVYGGTLPEVNTMSAIVDVNNDGHPDIILGAWHNDGLVNPIEPTAVLLNDGTGHFTSAPITLPPSGIPNETVLGITPIDLNGDNLPDLIVDVTSDGSGNFYKTAYLQLLVNDGNGHFHDETQLRLPQSTNASASMNWYKTIKVVDLNHDGHPDIVAFGDSQTPATIFMNDGTGHFAQGVQLGGGDSIGDVADIDHSGMYSIITASTDNAGFDVWANTLTNGHIYEANFGGDTLLGSSGNDTFIAKPGGRDVFTGNGGLDTLKLDGSASAYGITQSANALQVTGLNENVSAMGISRVVFGDNASIAYDSSGSAGQAYRIYQAAFNRAPDTAGLGYWIAQMDKGMSEVDVSARFIDSNEFRSLYGTNSTTGQFVNALYNNVLHRVPDQGGYDFYVNQIDTHQKNTAQVLADFSESPENQAQVIGAIQHGISYTAWLQ